MPCYTPRKICPPTIKHLDWRSSGERPILIKSTHIGCAPSAPSALDRLLARLFPSPDALMAIFGAPHTPGSALCPLVPGGGPRWT